MEKENIIKEKAYNFAVRIINLYKFLTTETRKKLEESLFGVIFKNLGIANPKRTITLTEQFRMHPFIGDFISKVYYRGELKAGVPNQADLKKHNLSLNWAKDKVAVFCDVKKAQGIEESGKSKSRKAEAVRIVKLLYIFILKF